MTVLPLIAGAALDAPLAWRPTARRSRAASNLADVAALSARLPSPGTMLNVTGRPLPLRGRSRAAMAALAQANLMQPNHTPTRSRACAACIADAYGPDRRDLGARSAAHPPRRPARGDVDRRQACRSFADNDGSPPRCLTSGSTGAPVPHAKHWGLLVRNTRGGVQRLAREMGRGHTLDGVDAGGHRAARSTCTASNRRCSSRCSAALRSTPTGRSTIPPTIAARVCSARRARACWVTTPFPSEDAARTPASRCRRSTSP